MLTKPAYNNYNIKKDSTFIPVTLVEEKDIDKAKDTLTNLCALAVERKRKAEPDTNDQPAKRRKVNKCNIRMSQVATSPTHLIFTFPNPWPITASQLSRLPDFKMTLTLEGGEGGDSFTFETELSKSDINFDKPVPFEDTVLVDKNPSFFATLPLEIWLYIFGIMATAPTDTGKKFNDSSLVSFNKFRLTCRHLFFMDLDFYRGVYLMHHRTINPKVVMGALTPESNKEAYWLARRCFERICKKYPNLKYEARISYQRAGLEFRKVDVDIWNVITCLDTNEQAHINLATGIIHRTSKSNSKYLASICEEAPEDNLFDRTGSVVGTGVPQISDVSDQ